MNFTPEQISFILRGRDCADKSMNFFQGCVFYARNLTQEEHSTITKLIAAGGGCLLSGKPNQPINQLGTQILLYWKKSLKFEEKIKNSKNSIFKIFCTFWKKTRL